MSSVYFHPLRMDEKAYGVEGSKAVLIYRCLPGAFVINLISLLTRSEPRQMIDERIALLSCTAVSIALTAITLVALNALSIIWLGLEGRYAVILLCGSLGYLVPEIFQQRAQALRQQREALLHNHVAAGLKISEEAIRKIREKHGQAIG